jgi:hypothetical protein
MAAPTNAAKREKALANTEPSTHGTQRQLLRRGDSQTSPGMRPFKNRFADSNGITSRN